MGQCKTCKWWGLGAEPITDPRNTDWPPKVLDIQFCRHEAMVDINEDGYAAVPSDGFGLDYPVCDLVTGPEFGCVKWEADDAD